MLKFYKGFIKKDNTKIVTNYIKMTDIDRINMIKNQRNNGLNNQKKEEINSVPLNENKDIYRERINALKNIKKD